MNMLVISGTKAIQLFGNVYGVGHETCGLKYRPLCRSNLAHWSCHTELTHMGLDALDVVVGEQLVHEVEVPTRGQPGVLMQKISVLLSLVVADVHTELYVPLRLLHPEIELSHPLLAVPIHELVKLLEA